MHESMAKTKKRCIYIIYIYIKVRAIFDFFLHKKHTPVKLNRPHIGFSIFGFNLKVIYHINNQRE